MRDTLNISPCPAADMDVDDDLARSAPGTDVMGLFLNQNVTVHPSNLDLGEEGIMCPRDHQISPAPWPGILGEMLTEQENGFKVISENGGGGGGG